MRSLNRSGIQYMLTGAMAASFYGRARTTLDIDLVVAAGRGQLGALAKALERANLLVNERTLERVWGGEYRILTLKDKMSPHTVDIIFTDRPLEKITGRVSGLKTFYEAPESLILAKLRMLKVTVNSERAANDRQDIRTILQSAKIKLRSLRARSKAESTLRILEGLI